MLYCFKNAYVGMLYCFQLNHLSPKVNWFTKKRQVKYLSTTTWQAT